MTPIFFEGRFGWLHPAMGSGTRLGVVLCPAFAQEEVCTHYGLMALADRLAAAGIATIRFDYRGTGDSSDVPISLASMEADVTRAVDCLRQECHVGPVVLAGLRLGAAIAMRAAARIDGVAGLVLMAPVVSGQAYMRETRAAASVASLSTLDPVPRADSDQPLNTNGFHWSAAFQREVAAIDLSAADCTVANILIAPVRGDRRAPALATALRETGACVCDHGFADYDGYMQDPTTHVTPHATFAAIAAWTQALAGAAQPQHHNSAWVLVESRLVINGIEDVPLRFGPDDAVFGMLCRPTAGAAPIAALLLHEGSTHHIGNGRAYVTLARQLAHAGIASLRMDLAGMGDSPAGSNDRNPHYDPERLAEVAAGMDCLERAGYRRAVSFGLCSGAHTAFQVGLHDDRIVGIFTINLQKFIWHYGDDIRVRARNNKRTLRSYIRSMRNPGEWRRALRGDADLTGIARVLGRRGIARAVHLTRSLLPPAPDSELAIVRAQMQRLAMRRVHTMLAFSDEDPGLGEMTTHFGTKARKLAAFAPARMHILPRADHHFNATDARRRYFAIVEAAMTAVIAEHGDAA